MTYFFLLFNFQLSRVGECFFGNDARMKLVLFLQEFLPILLHLSVWELWMSEVFWVFGDLPQIIICWFSWTQILQVFLHVSIFFFGYHSFNSLISLFNAALSSGDLFVWRCFSIFRLMATFSLNGTGHSKEWISRPLVLLC